MKVLLTAIVLSMLAASAAFADLPCNKKPDNALTSQVGTLTTQNAQSVLLKLKLPIPQSVKGTGRTG